MNQLTKTFEGHNVRIVGTSEKPLFVLTDVCDVLEIGNARQVKARLEKDVISTDTLQTTGGPQQVTVINEDGLYDVILDSRKPQAKRFRKWVTSEVLPSIRKHGGYLTPEKVEEALLNPDTLIRLATDLKEERQKRIDAERMVETQKPKVLLAEVIERSDSSILTRDFAKLISKRGYVIGEKRFFAWLREHKYIDRKNRPYQQYMDMGLFELTEYPVVHSTGTELRFTPRITGKGQVYFANKLLGDSGLSEEITTNNQIN